MRGSVTTNPDSTEIAIVSLTFVPVIFVQATLVLVTIVTLQEILYYIPGVTLWI